MHSINVVTPSLSVREVLSLPERMAGGWGHALASLQAKGIPVNKEDGTLTLGRLGETMEIEEGYQAAKQTALAMIATIRSALGSLDQVARVVKTLGFVNSTGDFVGQPAVINGCSELFAELYGAEAGVGARSALPSNTLPGGMAVEIEMILEVKPL